MNIFKKAIKTAKELDTALTELKTLKFSKPTAPPPPISDSNERKEECLVNCFCGGKTELTGGTYGYPTYGVKCLRCGGRWSMNTYSQKEAIERWNIEHNKTLWMN